MATIANINNGVGESGLSARQKLNHVIDFVDEVAELDSVYAVVRLKESYINSATPTGKFLRDDGSWQVVSAPVYTLQNLVGNDPHVYDTIIGKGATDLLIKYTLSPNDNADGAFGLYDDAETEVITLNSSRLCVNNLANTDKLFFVNRNSDTVYILGQQVATQPWVSTTANTASNAAQVAAESYADGLFSTIMGGTPALAYDTIKELADGEISILTALGNRLRVDTNSQGLSLTEKTNAKTNINLQNVDNTSDINKPVSSAMAAALATKQPAGTYATGTGSATGVNTGDETYATIIAKIGFPIGTIKGSVNANAGEIAFGTGTANEVQSSSNFKWLNTTNTLQLINHSYIDGGAVLHIGSNTSTIYFGDQQGSVYEKFAINAYNIYSKVPDFIINTAGGTGGNLQVYGNSTFGSISSATAYVDVVGSSVSKASMRIRAASNLPTSQLDGEINYAFGRLHHYNGIDNTIAYLSDIKGTSTIIDFGVNSINEKIFTITDASCTTASVIDISTYNANQNEENFGVTLDLFTECFNGYFNLIAVARFPENSVKGQFKIKYKIN